MIRLVLAFTLVAVVQPFVAGDAHACSCATMPADEARVRQYVGEDSDDAMVIATVQQRRAGLAQSNGTVVLSIERIYDGDVPAQIEVPIGDGNTCGYGFGDVGTRHFVALLTGFPDSTKAGLQANGCSSFEATPGTWYYDEYGAPFLRTLERIAPPQVLAPIAPELPPVDGRPAPVGVGERDDGLSWWVAAAIAGAGAVGIAATAAIIVTRRWG